MLRDNYGHIILRGFRNCKKNYSVIHPFFCCSQKSPAPPPISPCFFQSKSLSPESLSCHCCILGAFGRCAAPILKAPLRKESWREAPDGSAARSFGTARLSSLSLRTIPQDGVAIRIPRPRRAMIVCTKGERILTPVCALAQNDKLEKLPF